MKVPFRFRTVSALVAALLVLSAHGGFAQQAASQPATEASPSPAQESVTLEQCVDSARASAPGLKLASVTLGIARSQLIQAQATNGLSLGAKGGYTHEGDLPGTLTSSTTPASAAASASAGSGVSGENIQGGLNLAGPATSVGLTAQHSIEDSAPNDQVSGISLSASQTVFDGYPGGRAAAAVQQADYTFRAAQVAYDASVKSVIYQVRQAYYTLLGDQDTVLIRQASVKQAEQNLAYYQGLLQAQRATQLDVLQNQVTLTQAQLDFRTAQNTVEVDRKNLSSTIGWPLDRQYVAADTTLPAVPSLEPGAALNTAYQNRSELVTLELNIAAANVNIALQRSQASPVISVNGSLGLGQDWTANVSVGSFAGGVSIALPVLDGGLRGAQEQQAVNQLASYKVQEDQQRQSITIAVENALFGVRDARDRLDLAGQNVKASQGQYDLQKARYAVGLVTTLDVLTAFQALTTAEVGLEQAKSNYNLALLNLNNVMGL